MRGENRSTRRKTSRSRVENQQQTQPTYDAGSGNRTRDTLVGGERSHHCANPAPQSDHNNLCLSLRAKGMTRFLKDATSLRMNLSVHCEKSIYSSRYFACLTGIKDYDYDNKNLRGVSGTPVLRVYRYL